MRTYFDGLNCHSVLLLSHLAQRKRETVIWINLLDTDLLCSHPLMSSTNLPHRSSFFPDCRNPYLKKTVMQSLMMLPAIWSPYSYPLHRHKGYFCLNLIIQASKHFSFPHPITAHRLNVTWMQSKTDSTSVSLRHIEATEKTRRVFPVIPWS